jgi:hypothetical protein
LNLIRSPLTPAEEADAVARRKAIYETIHPETKHGAAGANARWNATENSAVAFTSATAEATGKSERAVRMAAARGAKLGSDLKAIAGTSLDKGVELDALARKENPASEGGVVGPADLLSSMWTRHPEADLRRTTFPRAQSSSI